MPHLILEHNFENTDKVTKVCQSLLKALSSKDTIKVESIKTRSFFVEDVFLGSSNTKSLNNFAHVNLKLLKGRSEDLKLEMSKSLLDTLKNSLGVEGSFSVEVSELLSYSK